MKRISRVLAGLLVALLAVGAGVYFYYRNRTQPELERPKPAVGVGVEIPTKPNPETKPGEKAGEMAGAGKAAGEAAAEAPMGPRAGETLDFEADVTKLNSAIALLRIKVGERRALGGKTLQHLQATVHTENPYRMVFELDDQFDSYSDPATLVSEQYEMHLSERGQKVDSVQRMMPGASQAAPAGMIAARVPAGTRDPLGMLYYLRAVDWSKTPVVRSQVYDGRKLYEVKASLVSTAEKVKVPAGSYTASKIELHVFENGVESKDAHFLLYLANDAERTPVLMEAVLPVATVRVTLTKAM